MRPQTRIRLILVASTLCLLIGCSRHHYRVRADQDAYARVMEKSGATPWMAPNDYSVYPAPHSRLYDPSPIEDPCLPTPSPQLYEYELPPLEPRDNERFKQYQQSDERDETDSAESQIDDFYETHQEQQIPPQPGSPQDQPPPPIPSPGLSANNLSANNGQSLERVLQRSSLISKPDQPAPATTAFVNASFHPEERLAQLNTPSGDRMLPVAPPEPTSGIETDIEASRQPDLGDADLGPDSAEEEEEEVDDRFGESTSAKKVPLPRSYWQAIPQDCLSRMFEFETVRQEYAASFGSEPNEQQLDDAPRLALEDIVDLTLLNSRELQAQKEQLFRSALALTLERFDYQLKPSVGNNGTATNYTHNRTGGITDDTLVIPSSLQLEKLLYTGGDFVGRFANSVLLTFNGPQGFAVDVGSDLLFSFSQSILQRDVRLENLTQAERNVVYAARDFTRFRKELFVQQASDYYSLILQFRQIEINCQNYFTLAREFNQRSVEIRYGLAARTELDQVEQQVINGRQSILSTCTALENALDSLKIRMGIPTEQPLNLDLSELDLLTLRDELAVNAELIARTRSRIILESKSDSRSAFVIVGSLARLVEQMLDSYALRDQLGENPPSSVALQELLLELRIEGTDIDLFEPASELTKALGAEKQVAISVIQRRRDVIVELLKKVNWQIKLLDAVEDDPEANAARIQAWERDIARLERLERNFDELADRLIAAATAKSPDADMADGSEEGNVLEAEVEADVEAQLVLEAESLQNDIERVATQYDEEIGRVNQSIDGSFERRAFELVEELLQASESFGAQGSGGLVPIQIDMDDAMMTALVQRFDLMNQRGFLADDWRQIKFAADDLRSVLNLQASQSFRTPNDKNRPFDFSFDDSTTSVGAQLDLPFNRRAQRNQYRSSLFNYQSTLRGVMQLEDGIKLSVRRDLRTLTLDRQQYVNDVAGAALALSRVTGTEIEVRNGLATSRDFLESQNAYVQAISSVAGRHINYIAGRLQLFLDLESLTVGDNGFWNELYDENYQPQPYYHLPGYEPAYGRLHPKLKYSPRIRRMQCVPNGHAMIHDHGDSSSVMGNSTTTDAGAMETRAN